MELKPGAQPCSNNAPIRAKPHPFGFTKRVKLIPIAQIGFQQPRFICKARAQLILGGTFFAAVCQSKARASWTGGLERIVAARTLTHFRSIDAKNVSICGLT